MLSDQVNALGWHTVHGNSYDIGIALGRAGHNAVHRHLLPSSIWAEVTAPCYRETVATMAANTRHHFPAVWEELEGLADGLALPLDAVFAWNCRGDLLPHVPDGCTTLAIPGDTPLLAHNEDGLPFFRGHCFIAEINPDQANGFMAFCYPGSIPGHTLAITRQGFVQAVNNLRLHGVKPTMPRMVLGRAALYQNSVATVIALLEQHTQCGGFHFSLAERGRSEVVSVEFGAGALEHRELSTSTVHANHALFHAQGLAAQSITASSHDRQQRGEQLLAAGEQAPLTILHDQQGNGLPILRLAADDPDQENTLATAVMRIEPDGVAWEMYDRPHSAPAYAGKLAFGWV